MKLDMETLEQLIMEEMERLDEKTWNTSKSEKGGWRQIEPVLKDLEMFRSDTSKGAVKKNFGDYKKFQALAKDLAANDKNEKSITQKDIDDASNKEKKLVKYAATEPKISKTANQKHWKNAAKKAKITIDGDSTKKSSIKKASPAQKKAFSDAIDALSKAWSRNTFASHKAAVDTILAAHNSKNPQYPATLANAAKKALVNYAKLPALDGPDSTNDTTFDNAINTFKPFAAATEQSALGKNALTDLTNAYKIYDNLAKGKDTTLNQKNKLKAADALKDTYLALPVFNPDAKLSSKALATLDSIYTSVDMTDDKYKTSFSGVDLIQTQTDLEGTPGDVMGSTSTTPLKGGIMAAPTIAIFNNFFGFVEDYMGEDSIDGRMEVLVKFSNELQKIADGTPVDAANTPLVFKMKDRPDQLSNAAQVLKGMDNLSKRMAKMESGKALEAYLAALMSGGVVGGANGASDMVSGKTDAKVLLSAKFYSTLAGDNGIKQKEGAAGPNNFGIRGTTDKFGVIFYVMGYRKYYDASGNLKPGGKSLAADKATEKLAAVEILVCGIGKRGTDGAPPQEYPIYTPLGKVAGSARVGQLKTGSTTTLTKASVGQVMIGNAIAKHGKDDFSLGDLVLFHGDKATIGISSVDQMINKAVDEIKNSTLIAIRNIYQKLQKMDQSTKQYTADQTAFDDDAYQGIRDSYTGIKDDFNSVIEHFGIDTTGGTPVAKHAKLAESKQNQKNSIKTLDKLIEQVILSKVMED
jgi:hypothetical protein